MSGPAVEKIVRLPIWQSPYNPRTLLNSQPVIVTVIDPAIHRVQFQNDTALNKLGDLAGQTCHEGITKCGVPCS